MSKAITEKQPDDRPSAPEWSANLETAPSVVREDEPTVARTIGVIGAAMVIFAGTALTINAASGQMRIGSGRVTVAMALGLMAMLFHASFDRDVQVRRLYWILGCLGLVAGVICSLIPFKGEMGGGFGVGFLGMSLGLLFYLTSLRHETEAHFRTLTLKIMLGAGAGMALVALIFSQNFRGNFLEPYGFLIGLLGLAYLASFVSCSNLGDDLAFRVGQGIGILGGLTFLLALGRSVLPMIFESFGWISSYTPYLAPSGLMLMFVGGLYLAVSLGLTSENRIVVMTRRELASFFFSPIAYIVLIGTTCVGWIQFALFVTPLTMTGARPLEEPIVRGFFIDLAPILCVICGVPLLTMRLLSEEKRSGTLEVLLTAPVDEFSVVLSKFLACMAIYMLLWIPWALFLVGLRLIGGRPFDYSVMLTYLLALFCTGTGFVGMGLFFSSLTRNQIASAVLTFAGMVLLTLASVVPFWFPSIKNIYMEILRHTSYMRVWDDAFRGEWYPKFLIYQLSTCVFWLFVTIKVLESRKWR